MELATLRGSPKQIAWAEDIRSTKIKEAESRSKELLQRGRQMVEQGQGSQSQLQALEQQSETALGNLRAISSANWWINSRTLTGDTLLREAARMTPEFLRRNNLADEKLLKEEPTFKTKDTPSISPRAAESRFEKEHVATGRSKKRSTNQDKQRRAQRVAPDHAKTPEDLRLQQEWFQHPNQLDFEGVDTPDALKEDRPLKERPMRDRSFRNRGGLRSRRL